MDDGRKQRVERVEDDEGRKADGAEVDVFPSCGDDDDDDVGRSYRHDGGRDFGSDGPVSCSRHSLTLRDYGAK